MPWGWECRARHIKQVPVKPTERRGRPEKVSTPGPNEYDAPQIFCGPGFDRIKRAPAYTFGQLTKLSFQKPSTTPNAPVFNVQGLGNKGGQFRITHGVVTPRINPLSDRTKKPGPAQYRPVLSIRYKKTPAYTMRAAAKPPYEPWDMWTAPPNMYYPQVSGKKAPAYTLGYGVRLLKPPEFPGPGDHDPNHNCVKRNKPAYTFGHTFRRIKPLKSPPPNIYCEKKFMVTKRTNPAPSFGIRHSPFVGQQEPYLKPSKLELALNN